jgi:hypothetical protein
MRWRRPVLAVSLALLALPTASGLAQDEQHVTFAQAAAQADFPVFEPLRTLGLKARVVTVANMCVPTGGERMVIASYGRRSGRGPQIGIWQAKPFVCGDPGESRPYRTVRIRHRAVAVRVSCESPEPQCRLHEGRTHSFVLLMRVRSGKRHRLTSIEMLSSHVPFARFVRAARSLRRVKPDETTPPPATVRLTSFLSDDRKVWCGISTYRGDRWCTTAWPDQYGAHVFDDGTVVLCGLGQPAENSECAQQWDPSAPVLEDGQSSDVGGYVCADQAGAVTCTVKSGAGAGHGFRVDVNGSHVLEPASPVESG